MVTVIDAACRVVRAIIVTKVLAVRNSPTEMVPCTVIQPPTTIVATMPMFGMLVSTGWKTAVVRASRIRSENRRRASRRRVPYSRSSWTKALTIRTPETVSSTCVATSAVCCWDAQVAAFSCRRLRAATAARTGTWTRTTRASGSDSQSMTAAMATVSTAAPTAIGAMESIIWIWLRSEIDRLTS
jgi:hypothetical protein